MATPPPSATPAPTRSSGPGCLLAAILLPLVVLAGIVIGTVLNRPDEPEEERSVTLDEGTIGDTTWRVDAVRDIEGDTCAFLYEDGAQLVGSCQTTPEDASFGDETVVFGKADEDAASVQVLLSDGEVVEVDTITAEGIDGRFYVVVVEGDVDAERLQP